MRVLFNPDLSIPESTNPSLEGGNLPTHAVSPGPDVRFSYRHDDDWMPRVNTEFAPSNGAFRVMGRLNRMLSGTSGVVWG